METRPAALLVDDDPIHVSDLRRVLGKRAVTVDVASNADAAMVMLDANRYEGIVLDLASSSAVFRHMDDRQIRIPIVVTGDELPKDVGQQLILLLLPNPCATSLLASAILGLCGIES